MRCISPIEASLDSEGGLVFSSRLAEPGLIGFRLECRKCLPCRLNSAREKAIRAVHEAKMHDDNIFLTLTYDDKHLESPVLIYEHFQLFMKALRNRVSQKVTFMVTGEYGKLNKRPHWHAIIFNFAPTDFDYKYTTDLDHKVYKSKFLDSIWKRGECEFGSVTMDSAGYVARYAAKKLVHGRDEDHDYQPIHKVSSKRAIGRSWIEKHWKYTFDSGFVNLPDGTPCRIPRYYVDWFRDNHFDEYMHYYTGVREKSIVLGVARERKEEIEYLSQIMNYKGGAGYPRNRSKVEETILKSKFKHLQERLRL